MSVNKPIKSIEHIRKIASIMDIDYDVKTGEFTQYSNDRLLIQDTLMHYQQAMDKINELKDENTKLRKALEDLVFHSIEMAAISKARGAEILETPLIDLINILEKKARGSE